LNAQQSHAQNPNLNPKSSIDAARFVLPWFVPAIFSLALKMSELGHDRGFRVVARYIGRVEGTGDTGLSLAERLTFFRSDILFGLVLIPLALWMLFRLLPRAWCTFTTLGISGAVSIVLFLQYRSLEEMGQFVSLPILRVALIWAWHDPAANAGYLFTREFGMLLAGIAAIALIAAHAKKASWKSEKSALHLRVMILAGILYAVCVLPLCGLAWRPLLPATAYHRNVMAQTFEALLQKPRVDTSEFIGLSTTQLVQKYREVTGAPPPQESSGYFGRERGANVIFIILETTAARFLPPDDSLSQFPNLKRLAQNAFVTSQHYSVYPYTNRAVPSIFSSWYPSDGLYTFSELHPGVILPGLAPTLNQHGYATGIYMPSPVHGGDVDMVRSLSFSREVYPDPDGLSPFMPQGVAPSWKSDRIARDRAVFKRMETDIESWLTAGRPFAAAFLPQLGHLPWPDAETASSEADIQRRGRSIIAAEDEWFGELIATLERHHQLENTVIVITGDHGIRTSHEDPNFAGGKVDEYSFHVPLYIYAPRAASRPVAISWLTSHVDVTPTVLDLLGVDRNRDAEQGTAIWNPAISQRTTFFFSRQAFGADGYYAGGKFFTASQMSGTTSVNSEMHFGPNNILQENSVESSEVTRQIERMIALDEAWDLWFTSPKR
jgi:phosphoglycerol transferase MdoB-like AlkP superfamily enzyme